MNKKLILILLSLLLLIACERTNESNISIIENEEQDSMRDTFNFEDYLDANYGHLNIQYRQPGVYTGGPNNEVIILFEDSTERLNKGDENQISSVYFFIYDDNHLIDVQKLKLFSLPYTDEQKEAIAKSAESFNVPSRPFFTIDSNENGKEEIFLFSLTGINFGIVAIEYHTIGFETILASTEFTKVLHKVELKEYGTEKTIIRIYGPSYDNENASNIDWFDVVWNEKSNKFELYGTSAE